MVYVCVQEAVLFINNVEVLCVKVDACLVCHIVYFWCYHMSPHVYLQSTGCLVATAMLECLENDQQLSVRFYMEWLTTLILSTHTQLVESLLLPQLKMVSWFLQCLQQ